MLPASGAALSGASSSWLLSTLAQAVLRAPAAAAACSALRGWLGSDATGTAAPPCGGSPWAGATARPFATAAFAAEPDILSLVQPRRRQQCALPQPAAAALAVRRYRTVNHDSSEALEHALEPWTPRPDPHRLVQAPPAPPAADALLALGGRFGVADAQAYVFGVQKLSCERQYSLLKHCKGVAAHLQSLGIAAPLVGRMLQHCPALFSYPAADRAAPLLAELMSERLGLRPAQAAEVFCHCPALGNTKNVMPAIVRLVVEQHALSWQAAPADPDAEHA